VSGADYSAGGKNGLGRYKMTPKKRFGQPQYLGHITKWGWGQDTRGG